MRRQTHIRSIVSTLLLLAALMVLSQAHAAKQPSIDLEAVQRCLHQASAKHQLSPALLFAIAEQESGFNPNAVGYTGIAFGLMQVYWDVHKHDLQVKGVSFEALFDPCTNADAGAAILRKFMKQYGESWKAVGAYYAGNQFAKEADRQWYAAAIAKRVAWYQRHGTNITAIANLRYRGAPAGVNNDVKQTSSHRERVRTTSQKISKSTAIGVWEVAL